MRRVCPCFSSSLPLFVPLFALLFVLGSSLLWLSLLVLLHCLSFSTLALCFLFPFRTTRKKKGREGLSLASSLVLLWVALSGCGFVLCELVRTQSVNIVTKFYIKIFAAGAANFFALACVLTCVVVNLSFFSFHISSLLLFLLSFSLSVLPYPITLIFPPHT